ncbi:MAG: hypothetical protein HZA67_11220 [Rhodospirillales bacterium]|jgi:hypothetical protein|nr:hypothetical protein [Rhodospirillales bacterium]
MELDSFPARKIGKTSLCKIFTPSKNVVQRTQYWRSLLHLREKHIVARMAKQEQKLRIQVFLRKFPSNFTRFWVVL